LNLIETLARLDDHLRKHILKLPSILPIYFYSNGRKLFLKLLENNLNFPVVLVPEHLKQKLWGIEFRSPIFNAAGMFKAGYGYEMVARQGAGAFLAGTTTSKKRKGNKKNGVLHPFMPYPTSGAASNWMGLPNESHAVVASRLAKIVKKAGCPVGASIAADSGLSDNEILTGILEGLELYDNANVDFIELNESCPNVQRHRSSRSFIDSDITARLVFISEKFLKKRVRNLPVIVKFSNDIDTESIPALIDLLVDLQFDGINIGNTSTKYDYYRTKISHTDIKNFDYFTKNFGGGLSGAILRENSLEKSKFVAEYIQKKNLQREFHVIRTGGISTPIDIIETQKNLVPLCQWFTTYFDNFAKFGYSVYSELYRWL